LKLQGEHGGDGDGETVKGVGPEEESRRCDSIEEGVIIFVESEGLMVVVVGVRLRGEERTKSVAPQ